MPQEDNIYTWYKVNEPTAISLKENALIQVTIGDKPIGLLKRSGAIFAFSANCPHASGNLCEGWVDARGNISCPVHGYRFDPHNGRNTTGEGYKLKTYPVEIREDFIYIGII